MSSYTIDSMNTSQTSIVELVTLELDHQSYCDIFFSLLLVDE